MLAEEMELTRSSISRYFNEFEPNYKLIKGVLKLIPNADLNALLKDDYNVVNEETDLYGKSPEMLLSDIKKSVSQLEEWHKNDTEKK